MLLAKGRSNILMVKPLTPTLKTTQVTTQDPS